MENFNDFDMTVTEFVFALTKEHKEEWRFVRRDREFFGLLYFYEGEIEYRDDTETVRIKPRTVAWFPKGKSYTLYSTGEKKVGFVGISFLKQGGDLPFRTFEVAEGNARIGDLFFDILKLSTIKGIAYNLIVKSKLSRLLFEVVRAYANERICENRTYECLKKSEDYIHEHLSEDISVEMLAQISGYCISHYRKRFSEHYGVSPVRYINSLRIERAKELMLSDMHTQSEIAELCGFVNQQYFSRVFKAYTGKTPGEF